MDETKNIITIDKSNKRVGYSDFCELMDKTEVIMNDEAVRGIGLNKKSKSNDVESYSLEKIKQACSGTIFNPNAVKLVSGQKFPDIVAEKYYGIEVKCTKSNSWKSTGSSIVESTRVESVSDIFMLFAKLGGEVPEYKLRPYQDVLSEIAITHSPRYMIDMNLEQGNTIFNKMGTTYEELRTSDDCITKVRLYYREQARKKKQIAMPWWLTEDNMDRAHSFNIQMWSSLPLEERQKLLSMIMILFPESLSSKRSSTKYNRTSLWLCSYAQVINTNIRDLFSAGGCITGVNGKPIKNSVPQVFNNIVQHADMVRMMLKHPTKELLSLIQEYNPQLLKGPNKHSLYDNWLNMCQEKADDYGISIIDWIKDKPEFEFSQKNK